ncbi:MAG: hypothetical protein A2776_02485 [Candidatus Levybacteria bacterium RIFCSPHIGHO2_01_FULL_40_10]|nr:MAG: hypothetical protein A2776_02485 [Candidatus Levybacteria bacterium RIFCSPHIGHO2_01_FULL_40_10]
MKKIFKFFVFVFIFFLTIQIGLPKSLAYEDGAGGDTTDGDAGGAQGSAQAFAEQAGWPPSSVASNGQGGYTASDPNSGACGNSGSSASFGSSGGGGGEGGGEPPGGGGAPVCIPDGQGCPQSQSVRVMTSPGKYCSPAQQINKICTPKAAQYSSQEVQINCCTACNNGVCGGGPPPNNPPPPDNPPPPPACNQPCPNDQRCIDLAQQAGDGCVKCVIPPGQQNGTCQAAPTSTPGPSPTPTPPHACDSACVRDSDCAGAVRDSIACNVCINNKCSVKPSPTPTKPPFNPDACKCDGIEYTDFVSDQNVTITARSKVMGADVSKAKVVSNQFFLVKGAEQQVAEVARSNGPIPASLIPSESNSSVEKYKASWTFNMPQLESGATYKIFSSIVCMPKDQAVNYTGSVNIASSEQPKTSVISKILAFAGGLLGLKETSTKTPMVPTYTPAPIAVDPTGTLVLNTAATQDSLQLGTISPTEVYFKDCSVIKFRYNF